MNENNQGQGNRQVSGKSPFEQYAVQPQQKEEDKSPYYKSTTPSISLPKGGGAIKGIDEKFTVNAVNGTAALEIPLPLTPGRSGFTPALSISYNSGSGNSEFGLGWNLSLPAIRRKTDKKLPRYDDNNESDVFLLAGAEDLVPELDGDGNRPVVDVPGYKITRYRPRIEGLFARIEHIQLHNDFDSWWRVTTKDNITTYYGLNYDSRITDPSTGTGIYAWLPDITVDHKGNVQQFIYKAEDVLNVPSEVYERHRLNYTEYFTNTYLKRILYGNKTPYFIGADVFQPALPENATWLFEAVMDYGEHAETGIGESLAWPCRTDAFSGFHAGFEIRTYRRCKRVMMFHRFEELNQGNATLVRALELQYKNDGSTETATETDYIIAAVQKGYTQRPNGDYVSKALPAMQLEYTPFQWNTIMKSVAAEDFAGAPQGLTGPYQWVDFEGEGISGILTEQANGWFYKSNLGDGHFGNANPIAEKPSFSGLNSQLQWQDLDADGRRQVVNNGAIKGFWELDDDQRWQPFRTFAHNLNIDWNSPFTKTLDLDGDGRPDVLITEDRAWTWYANKGTAGFTQGGNAPVFLDEDKGPVLLLRDTIQSIFLADINGDGLTDLVRIRNGEVCYWPNKGYGAFGAKVTMGNAPLFAEPDMFNPLYLSLADISGTGAADLIYTGQNKCMAWINLSGNAWSDAYHINPLPGTDAYSKIAVLDFLGNGTGCIVWSSPLPQYATAPIHYIDLMGGKKPYLLERYNNGTGKKVTVEYKSSTRFYLDDKLAGITWATRLPFPVQCISKLTTFDQISGASYSQSYKYRHGYYDHEEREFRGFGYVETLDIDKAAVSDNEDMDQYPVLTKTWYHTGAWIREGTLLDRFKEEYFPFEGWDDLTIIATFELGLNPQEQREAYRALKGSALRQEVYALDNSSQRNIPYTVTASAYTVKKVQPLGSNRYASFLNYQQQSVAFNCERDTEDPRVLHDLTLEVDEYGNVKQKAQVAYKRKDIPLSLPDKVREEQAKMHITCSDTVYTNDAISQSHYRLRLPYQTKAYEAKVTTNEVENGALWTVASLKAAIEGAAEVPFEQSATSGEKRLLSYSRTKFRQNNTVTVLDFGVLESLAIPHESYQLAFTETILAQAYEGRVDEAAMLTDNSYIATDGDTRYWVPSGRLTYMPDPALSFYTPIVFTDPWNVQTMVSYDNNWLFPVATEDVLGNVAGIERINWRILQPELMIDINGNFSEIKYDALGMPIAMALKGKGNNTGGDTLSGIDPENPGDLAKQATFMDDPEVYGADLLQGATWRCVYDFNNLPFAVAMIARQHHVYGAAIPPGQNTEPLIRFSFSDGMGRVIMHKAQAQPTLENGGKDWLGSGRTIYNNKGNPVMQYEPYYSWSFRCDTTEQAAAQGVSPKMYYDPLGRLQQTQLPDGSFTMTQWTAWQQTLWDNNDTVLESQWYLDHSTGTPEEQDAAAKAEKHASTPTIVHTDTLARAFYTIQHNRYPDSGNVWQDQYLHSYVNLDIQGNRLSVIDGRGLESLQYSYNMLQTVCRQNSLNSGEQFTLMNVAGQPAFAWDADNRRFRMAYDLLRRPTEKWMALYDETTSYWATPKLLERTIYGEDIADDQLHNLRGQIYRHYDGSGMQQISSYDFKGNILSVQQQLLADRSRAEVDWDSSPSLSAEVFTTGGLFDALNRPIRTTDPGGNEHEFVYDRSGALKIVQLNGNEYVKDIHYDAKGQRQAIWYGNKTKTGYTYDPFTFRLSLLLTVNLDTSSPNYNKRLQDLSYYYDPVGNITKVIDAAQEEAFFNNTVISPSKDFTYDALYRLVKAMGRERKNNAAFGTGDNHSDQDMQATEPMKWDANALQNYTQKYAYDAVGNILSLQHIATLGSYTREYDYNNNNNQLLATHLGSWDYTHAHDRRGNMLTMPHLSALNWNGVNELGSVTQGTTHAYYQYGGGQRVRKWVDKESVKEERIYLGPYEIYRKFTGSSLTPDLERITLHISDDSGRIAMLEKRTIGMDASIAKLQRYIYSNHLSSATLELDEEAEVISYEEYHPYGTTAYQANSQAINAVAKRYRYTGKERDEESGLYYHGARYYIPWLCRWSACDPLESKYGGMSPYNYSFNNPVMFNDPSGMEGEKWTSYARDDSKTQSIPKSNNPEMPPINIPGKVDNARDVRSKPAPIIPAKPTAPQIDLSSVRNPSIGMPSASKPYNDAKIVKIRDEQAAFQKEMSERATLDPYAHNLASSVGVQAGMALVMPGYGEAMSGLQIYSGIQSGDNTQVALGSAGLLLSGYSSYSFYKNGGYAGSLTIATESKFIPAMEMPVSRAATTEVTSVNVGVGTKISLSIEEASKVNPVYNSIQLTKKTFGHTFTTHGEEMTNFLLNRAKGSGMSQGQFLDNQMAAKFILENLDEVKQGATSLPIPQGFPARMINPDGSFGIPTKIRLVPSGTGVKTAYPEF